MLGAVLRATRPVIAAGLALTALAGCGSDDGEDAKKQATPTPSATGAAPEAYLPVPDDVTLTEPGTALGLGEEGVVAFQRRQDEVGVLAVSVRRIERTSFQESFAGWEIDGTTAARTPYFARVEVTNVGDVDLGGMRLDNVLWGDDGTTLEAPNYYGADQLPVCSGDPLPTPFAAGATAQLCQVYFIAPTRALERVSFSPFGGLDAVSWSGELSPVDKPGKKGRKDEKAQEGTSETASATPSGDAS
ncbi:hypothetical protein KVF89_06995 [Nocardioides carbamazepini]|uniref:hypothetical protein n=1 Tax=Nocardioides carbamazepini TaxID=2854259 RepID=UPI00214A4A41|nr:hypothetical protein [Nocardioides carbamazepini]MCR1782273.1 hypothetical protein [Nocardioides carbamazepini]